MNGFCLLKKSRESNGSVVGSGGTPGSSAECQHIQNNNQLLKIVSKTKLCNFVCLLSSRLILISGIQSLLKMQDSNMFTDEDLSKLKSQKRKLLPQMTSVSQQPAPNEAGPEVTVIASKMPKAFKRSQKNEITQKRLENTKSPQDGLCESSPLTKSGNEYRALRRKYLLLEEEGFSLAKELEHIETDVKNLEEEKLALLDQLVVLEGLVEPPNFQSPGHKS